MFRTNCIKHFLHSSSVCVLLTIDIVFGCARIKLDINGITSYRIAYKNISIYRTNSIYRPALFQHCIGHLAPEIALDNKKTPKS